MADVEFVENPDGMNALRQSNEMRTVLERYTSAIYERAMATLSHSDGFDYQYAVEGEALVGHVWAAGAYATNSNAKHLTLIRELSNQ